MHSLTSIFSRLASTIAIVALLTSAFVVLDNPSAAHAGTVTTDSYGTITLPYSYAGTISSTDCANPARGAGYYGDLYKVSSNATTRLYMGTGWDTFLQVLDGNKTTIITQDDDSGTGTDAYINSATVSTSQYVVATTYSAGSTGSYTIHSDVPLTQVTNCPQVITVSAPSSIVYGSNGTVTASTNMSQTVTVTSQTPSVCSVVSAAPTFTISALSPGTCTLVSSQAGNGSIEAAANVTTNITISAKPLTITGLSGNKNYDGLTSTTLTGTATLSGIVGSDTVSLIGTPTGTYNTANAGTNTITVSGLSLTGAAASKYTLTNTFSGVISKINQTMSWTPNTTLSTTNTGSTFTAATTTTGGGAITYAVTSAGTTGCTVSGTTLSFTTSGSCTVRATAAATTNYNAATTDSTFVISKVNQTITWSPLTTLLAMPSSTILSAATTSGNGAISYAIASAGTTGCTISGTTLTYSASGTCQVTATAAATNTYNLATSTLTFTIDKATQTAIAVDAANPTLTFNATTPATTTVSISGGSGTGEVSYVVTSASSEICSIIGSTVTALGAGTCVVEATKAGDGVYLPRTGTLTLSVAKGVQTNFTVDAFLTTLTYSASPAATTEFSVTGGNGSGAESVAVDSGSESVCSITGSTVIALSAGTCVLNATKAADTNYLIATDSVTITIAKASQSELAATASRSSITITGTHTTSELSFTGGSGTGASTWSIDSASTGICSLSGTTVTAVASGTCVINLVKAADTNFLQASDSLSISVSAALQSALTVAAADTSLSFSATDLTFTTVSISGGNGTGRIWFETVDAEKCVVGTARNTVDGIRATVTALHAGTCQVRGHKDGDANYAAAESTLIEIAVAKGTQSELTISLESALTYSANPIASTHLLTLGGSGSGSVTYSLVSGPCTLVANELSAANAGDCVVRATKAADQDFTEVVAENTFTVAKANQAALTLGLTEGSIATLAWDGKKTSSLEVAGGTGSGALSATTNSIEICTVSVAGSIATVTAVAAGTCTVTVTKATSTNYLAKSATFEFTVIDLPSAPTNVTITNTGVVTDDGTAVEISWTPIASVGTQAEVSGYEVQFKSGLNWVRAEGGLVDAQTSSITVYPTPWTALFIRVAPVSTFDAEDGVRHNWTNYTGTAGGTAPVAFNIAGRLDNISSPIVAASSGEPVIINGTDFDQTKTNQVEITTASAVLPARLGVAAVTTAVKTVPAVVISPTKLSFVVPKITLPTGRTQLSATVRVLSTTGVRSEPVAFNYVPKKLAQTIAVTGLPPSPNLVVGTAVNGNLGALGALPTATATANICSAAIGDNGALRITPIAKGKCVVTIQAPATPGYTAAAAKVLTFTVLGVSQTITFADPADRVWSDESFALPVTAGSNLPVAVTSTTPLICSVAALEVTMLKSGVCTLKATQSGSAGFEAAAPVTQSFTITKANRSANLTATIQSLANDGTEADVVIAASPSAPTQANVTVAIGTDPLDRVVTLSQREGTVVFTVDAADDAAGRCVADAGIDPSLEGVITLTDLGSCKVTISQLADDRFNAGVSVVIWINSVAINSNVTVPEDVDTGDAVASNEDTDSTPADPDTDPAVALSLPSTGGTFDVGGDVGIGYKPTTGVLSINTKTAFVGTFKVTMTSPAANKKWFTVSKKPAASCVLTLTVKKDAKLKKSVVRLIGPGCVLSAEGKAALTAVGIQKVKIAYVFNRAYAKTGLAYMGTAKAKTRILTKIKRTIVLNVGRVS